MNHDECLNSAHGPLCTDKANGPAGLVETGSQTFSIQGHVWKRGCDCIFKKLKIFFVKI